MESLHWASHSFHHGLSYIDRMHADLRQDRCHVLCGNCRNQCFGTAELSIPTRWFMTFQKRIMQVRSKNKSLPPNWRLEGLWNKSLTFCYSSFSCQFENIWLLTHAMDQCISFHHTHLQFLLHLLALKNAASKGFFLLLLGLM